MNAIRGEVRAFGKSHRLIKGALLRLIVGDEDCLPHKLIPLRDMSEQPAPHSGSLRIRMDQNALDVADRCIVGDGPDQADRPDTSAPRRDDKR